MLLEIDTGGRRQRQPLGSSGILPAAELLSGDDMNGNPRKVAPQPELIGSKDPSSAFTNGSKAPISHPLLPPEVQGVTPVHENEINENDVLCGRGGDINSHIGNEQFRRLVESKKNIYLTARFKREKRIIAASVVDEIHRMNPPGRFLSKIQVPGKRRGRRNKGPDLGWYEIEDDKAREKASQALRENAPALRKELKQKQESQVSLNDYDDDMDLDQIEDRSVIGDKRSMDHIMTRGPPSSGALSDNVLSDDRLTQSANQQRWGPPPPHEHSQVLVPMSAYRNDSSSYMWDSIKSAGEAVSSMVSTCVGDLGQTHDDLPALPAPPETRMVLESDPRGAQKRQGPIGYMAAAASSMVNACLGGDDDKSQEDLEPLALPAPSSSAVQIVGSSRRDLRNPPPLEIRRGSFENYTNRRRTRVPNDTTASAPFSPIKVTNENGINMSSNFVIPDPQSHQSMMQHYGDWRQDQLRTDTQQTMDFEQWMEQEAIKDRAAGLSVSSVHAPRFHPGFSGNARPKQEFADARVSTFPDPPTHFRQGSQQVKTYAEQDHHHHHRRSSQPYLSDKGRVDSWIGPIASKSSDFSDMDVNLEGFINLSFDSPSKGGVNITQSSWERHQNTEMRENNI